MSFRQQVKTVTHVVELLNFEQDRIRMHGVNFALHHLVIRRVDIVVERGGNLLYAEGRQVAVIDALPEGVDVNRLAEVSVGIRVLFAFWRRG